MRPVHPPETVEPPPVGAPAAPDAPPAKRGLLQRLDPKYGLAGLITLILVVGEWTHGAAGGYSKIALCLGVCLAAEIGLSLFLLRRWPLLISAYITGNSLAILLRPAGGLVWPFVVGALLSIGSKYVLRYRGRHLWNPSNFGIALLLLLAPAQVAILSHEFGNELAADAVVWAFGLVIAARARILHVSLTYAASFAAFAVLRSVALDLPLAAEIAPLTGPMYQLLVFFMVTDPRTTPGTRRSRVVTVFLVALLEAGFRVANDLHLPGAELFAPAPAILALAIVGPLAMVWDLRRGKRAPLSPSAAPTAARPAVA